MSEARKAATSQPPREDQEGTRERGCSSPWSAGKPEGREAGGAGRREDRKGLARDKSDRQEGRRGREAEAAGSAGKPEGQGSRRSKEAEAGAGGARKPEGRGDPTGKERRRRRWGMGGQELQGVGAKMRAALQKAMGGGQR
jgi:hypothetical protein